MKEVKESQQASQGINIGNQGNQGGVMPEGAKGPHDPEHTKDDKHIPKQDRASQKSTDKNKL